MPGSLASSVQTDGVAARDRPAIITRMGVALWLACGLASFVIARLIPSGRPSWIAEAVITIVTGLLLGVVATALDFGGWNEADWRAGLFVVFGSFAAVGALRAVKSAKPSGGRP